MRIVVHDVFHVLLRQAQRLACALERQQLFIQEEGDLLRLLRGYLAQVLILLRVAVEAGGNKVDVGAVFLDAVRPHTQDRHVRAVHDVLRACMAQDLGDGIFAAVGAEVIHEIRRLVERFKGIADVFFRVSLFAVGEKGGFYSVILGSNKTGWISKNSVKLVDFGASLATMNGFDTLDTPEFKIYVFHLNKMTPFELVEGNPFTIKIFNVENQPENTYKLQIPLQKLYGYSGRFSGTDFVVKIRKTPPIDKTKPLKGIKITIDAGHGGSESGAIGCLGNLEKNTMLEFAKHLERELKHRGAIVFMTREDDSYVGLRDRVDFANDEDSVFLISLHGNALPDDLDPIANNGTEVYYYYNQAKPLADLVLSEITTQTGMNNHKVRQASFALVRNTNALSILIEIGFLINPSDNAKLVDKEFQKKTVSAIADGISNFLKN
mgnify:CR=1 FL=1